MKNEYAKAVEEIRASDELKQSIVRRALSDSSVPRTSVAPFRRRTAMVAVAAAFVLLFAIVGPLWLRGNDSGRAPAWFDGFAVTAYAADGAPINVKPNAEFPLGRYSMFMSSVPGFPVAVSAEGADRIEIRASAGELLSWSPSDSRVRGQGDRMDLKAGETFYWSPLRETGSSAADSAELEMTAYRQNEKLGSGRIEIKADDGGLYMAKWIED
ncbi:hypothetical protein CDO73_15550 [Saccharibacillus sp. O23]|uniref:hypothetical protein n=1 Tax=Saccharibacillus sp. O23 TaxID=2009338 RepID=UPI000B4DF1A4|nr:hypothetical protein [Saccharibacillus sp. O23]OWR29597.1 hypothetical protein CDO73_15550 [Saccharibacillus sp. O23]